MFGDFSKIMEQLPALLARLEALENNVAEILKLLKERK